MARFHYRIPLCPSYDIVSIQHWLERMAEKGLILDAEGYVFGIFQFQKGAPQPIRYRLEPITSHAAADPLSPESPVPEVLELNREYGWEYWGRYLDYYLYRTLDPNARELNTDPVVQAMALEPVRKRRAFQLACVVVYLFSLLLGILRTPVSFQPDKSALRVGIVLLCALFSVILYLGRLSDDHRCKKFYPIVQILLLSYIGYLNCRISRGSTPLLDIVNGKWRFWGILALCICVCLLYGITSYCHIRSLQKQLRRGYILHAPSSFRPRNLWPFLLILLQILLFLCPTLSPYQRQEKVALDPEAVRQVLPFPTLADLSPEREYRTVGNGRYASSWQSTLCPVNYDWEESAELVASPEDRLAGTLIIHYHKAATETIARRLVEEYAALRGDDLPLLPTKEDESDLDTLAVYNGAAPVLLLRKDNVVICATCSVQSWVDHEKLYPLWLEQMVNRLP